MCWLSVVCVRSPTRNGSLLHHMREYVRSFNNCLLRTSSSRSERLKRGENRKERQAAEHHRVEHDVSPLPFVFHVKYCSD